ncbi:MAG: YicC/YloC family endoribonuclease [Bacillota bacterium]|nr:YicC/YloC family endoribonuclease [Bacillota bacterium]
MVKSMTGFGRGEYSDEKRSIVCEIKSVNHRYSDITVKMPRRYQFAEEAIKALVKKVAPRGKIDVGIQVTNVDADETNLTLNTELAKLYKEKLSELKASLGDIPGEPDFRMIALMPEVLKAAPEVEDEEAILKALSAATSKALENFDKMRAVEGAKLAEDLLKHNDVIMKTRDEIEVYAPQVKVLYMQKLKDRIADLLGKEAQIPEERILTEAAVFADKSDITEELVRLKSHCLQLISILSNANESIGKKLDFLVQEMNRESNTIGSKANDINITNNVLILKAEVEKIREQVQNLE